MSFKKGDNVIYLSPRGNLLPGVVKLVLLHHYGPNGVIERAPLYVIDLGHFTATAHASELQKI